MEATLSTIIAAAAPLMFASLGETISEKSGVINLSLEGSLMLSALAGFAVAFSTNNTLAGFAAAAVVGATFALIVAFSSITLGLNQVAVGLTCRASLNLVCFTLACVTAEICKFGICMTSMFQHCISLKRLFIKVKLFMSVLERLHSHFGTFLICCFHFPHVLCLQGGTFA